MVTCHAKQRKRFFFLARCFWARAHVLISEDNLTQVRMRILQACTCGAREPRTRAFRFINHTHGLSPSAGITVAETGRQRLVCRFGSPRAPQKQDAVRAFTSPGSMQREALLCASSCPPCIPPAPPAAPPPRTHNGERCEGGTQGHQTEAAQAGRQKKRGTANSNGAGREGETGVYLSLRGKRRQDAP